MLFTVWVVCDEHPQSPAAAKLKLIIPGRAEVIEVEVAYTWYCWFSYSAALPGMTATDKIIIDMSILNVM